ncbi:MAG: hypothetical protein KGL39_60660 [Patescibacteria group bacterium]|nr:hypothetical protein [Patescibacteria group bacterium]
MTLIVYHGVKLRYESPFDPVFIDTLGVLRAIAELPAASMAADPKEPLTGRCRHCNLLLQSEASKARGECVRCAADRKQIGPDRPKG